MNQFLPSSQRSNGRRALEGDARGGELQQITPEQQQVLQTVLANQDVRALLAAVASPDADVAGHFADVARDMGASCEFSQTVEITIEE